MHESKHFLPGQFVHSGDTDKKIALEVKSQQSYFLLERYRAENVFGSLISTRLMKYIPGSSVKKAGIIWHDR
jgi:hypothetical protein